jgi:hypothetical protein
LGLQPCHTQARPKTLKTFSIFLIFFLKKWYWPAAECIPIY